MQKAIFATYSGKLRLPGSSYSSPCLSFSYHFHDSVKCTLYVSECVPTASLLNEVLDSWRSEAITHWEQTSLTFKKLRFSNTRVLIKESRQNWPCLFTRLVNPALWQEEKKYPVWMRCNRQVTVWNLWHSDTRGN